MNKLFLCATCAITLNANAATYLQPTIPGTDSRDFSQSATVIDDNGKLYSTMPATSPGAVTSVKGPHGYLPSQAPAHGITRARPTGLTVMTAEC